MSGAEPAGSELWLDRHIARNYGVYSIVIGVFWILYGTLRALVSIVDVSTNGLGRYATTFGLSRLAGYTSVTTEDIFFFSSILVGAAVLVVSGLLLCFRQKFAIYTGIASGALFAL